MRSKHVSAKKRHEQPCSWAFSRVSRVYACSRGDSPCWLAKHKTRCRAEASSFLIQRVNSSQILYHQKKKEPKLVCCVVLQCTRMRSCLQLVVFCSDKFRLFFTCTIRLSSAMIFFHPSSHVNSRQRSTIYATSRGDGS